MAARTLSIKMAIEGESEYKRQVAACNAEMSKLKTELAAVTSEYRHNAQSTEALTAKGKVLGEMYATQQKKIAETKSALENAKKAQNDHANAIDQYKNKIAETESKLKAMQESTEDTTDAEKALADELEKLKQGLTEAEQKHEAASRGVLEWEKKLNTAKVTLGDLEDELEDNNRQMRAGSEIAKASSKDVGHLSDSYKDAKESASDFSKGTSGAFDVMAGQLAASGVEGALENIKQLLSDCSQASREFEASMAEAFTLIPGATQSAKDKMSADMLEFSGEMNVLTTESVPALYSALSAGVPQENVFSFLETAQKAAVGGVTTLETSVDGLSSVVNAYTEEVITAEEAADVMFTTVKLGKTNFEQLSQSLYNVVPTAVGAGVAFQDVSAALAVLTAQGRPTSVATTQLRQMLVELSDKGSEVGKTFNDISGVSFQNFIKAGGDTQQALVMLEQHAQDAGLGINDLFSSVEAGSAALSLSGQSSEKYASALKEMNSAAGAVNTAYAQMADTGEYAQKRLEVAASNMQIAIGNVLAPALEKMQGMGAVAFEWATDFVNANPWIVNALSAVAVAMGVLTGSIAVYTAAVKIAKPATEALWDTISKHPIGVAVTAIIGLITAIATFIADANKMSAEVEALTTSTREMADAMKEAEESYKSSSAEIETISRVAEQYITRLEELEKQGVKTKAQQDEYRATVEQLNAIMPELNAQIDEETGLLSTSTATLRANATAIEENAKKKAYQEAYTEVIKARADAEVELETNIAARNRKEKERDGLLDELKDKEEELAEVSEDLGKVTADQGEAFYEAKNRADELREEMDDLQDKIDDTDSEISDLNEAIEISNDTLADADEKVQNTTAAMTGLNDSVVANQHAYEVQAEVLAGVQGELADLKEKYEEAYNATYESISGQMGLMDDYTRKNTVSIDKVISNLSSQEKYMQEYSTNLQKAMELDLDSTLLAELSDGSMESAEILAGIVRGGETKVQELNAQFAKTEEGKKAFADNVAKIKTDFDEKMGGIMSKTDAMITNLDQSDTAYQNGLDTLNAYIKAVNDEHDKVVEKFAALGRDATAAFNANAKTETPGSSGATPHAKGLSYVPYDGYLAELHKGERVLTASEARDYALALTPRNIDMPSQVDYSGVLGHMLMELQKQKGSAGPITINIMAQKSSPAQTARAVEKQMRRMIYG